MAFIQFQILFHSYRNMAASVACIVTFLQL